MALPAFLRDGAAAWRWAKRHLDLNLDEDSDQYQSRASTYAAFAYHAVRDGRVVVFRMVCVPSAKDIEVHNLGKAWSAKRHGVGCYNPTMGWGWAKPTREIVITASVSTNDIDWQYGFASFMNYGEDQWEVSMKPNAPVSILAIGDKTYQPPLEGNTGHAREGWTKATMTPVGPVRSSRAATLRTT